MLITRTILLSTHVGCDASAERNKPIGGDGEIMATRSVDWHQLAERSFPTGPTSESTPDVSVYIGWLREAIAENARNVRRSALYMISLVVIFELILGGGATEFELGPLKVTQTSFLLAFIPPLIAYFYAQVVIDSQHHSDTYQAYQGAFSAWNKDAYDNDLETVAVPTEPLFWNVNGGYTSTTNSRLADRG